MVHTCYCQLMAFLVIIIPFAAVVGVIVGYVALRDRRTRRSFVDPSISRDALIRADRQAVDARNASPTSGAAGTSF
jgi:hypothetical protein